MWWWSFAVGTLLDGEPIISLPPKFVELKKVDFSHEERDFYSQLEADSRAQFQVWFSDNQNLFVSYVFVLFIAFQINWIVPGSILSW